MPVVKRIFNNMAGNDSKIITSYTSVLGDGGLNLWADPLIKSATTTSDFSIYDLRRDPTSIFLVVSPNDLEVIAPLVRLFFQQIVSVLQRKWPIYDEIFEVLFLLDEFKHLGKLEAIETAVTTIAGYKRRFMFIIQSLSALTGAYEQAGKENFLSNTGIQVFMATADDETPQYISKAIGDYSYRARSVSWNRSEAFNANIQQSEQGANLIRPEQIRLLDENTQIVLVKGRPPLKMPKVKFYQDRNLKSIFEAQAGALPEPPPLSIILEPTTISTNLEQGIPLGFESTDTLNMNLDEGESSPFLPHDGSTGYELQEYGESTEDIHDVLVEQSERVARESSERGSFTAAVALPATVSEKQRALLERIVALQSRVRSNNIELEG